jgi:L-seryl-tRNA(Ser) seleniumtransferase
MVPNLPDMTQRHPPSVDALVRQVDDGSVPRPLVVEAVRSVIARWRDDPSVEIEAAVRDRVDGLRRSVPRKVVNATGVILHTNLGRAPWSAAALGVADEVAAGYANIELDLATGERGARNAAAERLVCLATGAGAALVVNNNAGAVLLTLMALGGGRPVPVSRGELVEIGGSYRLPELMAATTCRLVEVGTTNRTRIDDYAAVEDAALLLKVHTSNYRIVGFSEETRIDQLAALAAERVIPLVFDLGSGLLDAEVPWLEGPPPSWLAHEPGVRQALEAGADLVLFSGDKLVGGPQAGIIVGDPGLVKRLRSHPVARALRVDGSTTAALASTLAAYLAGAGSTLPVWRMAMASVDELDARARVVAASAAHEVEIVDGSSTVGAGSAPGAEIPTRLLRAPGADALHRRLLDHEPPILGRRHEGSLLLDLRTVDPADDAVVAAALARPWR